jgi:hypothetical protein
MVVMFVDCCVGGGRYFPYYSYHRNPMGKEFFVPAGTLIAVKLLSDVNGLYCNVLVMLINKVFLVTLTNKVNGNW